MIYTVNKNRPVNLDLASMKYPPMAIASILHRIAGILLFLLLPVLLYYFDLSLRSEESYGHLLQTVLTSPLAKLVLWVFTAAWVYHLLAGIRHMLMDIGYGEQLAAGRRSATLVIILALILAILLGVWIW